MSADDFRSALVQGLVRATLQYIDRTPEPPTRPRGKRRGLTMPATAVDHLTEFLEAEDCPELIFAARNGELPFDRSKSGTRWRLSATEQSQGWGRSIATMIFGLLASRDTPFISVDMDRLMYVPHLDFTDRSEDVPGICERVAAFILDDETAELDVVVIDNVGLPYGVTVGDGWTLRPASDPMMPIEFPALSSSLQLLHAGARCAALTHAGGIPADLRQPGSEGRAVTMPLLLLNLASPCPVRALTGYRLRTGLQVIYDQQTAASEFVPGEIGRWHPSPQDIARALQQSFVFDARSADMMPGLLAGLSGAIGRGMRLHGKQYSKFMDVADRFLSVGYHRFEPPPPRERHSLPFMHPSEAAARLAACAESLLMGGKTENLNRATSQRAALIVGRTDGERLHALDATATMYKIRSAHVHIGNLKASQSIAVTQLRELVRHIIIGWIVLTAEHGPALYETLDQALVSGSLRQQAIDAPIEAFWAAAAAHQAPAAHSEPVAAG